MGVEGGLDLGRIHVGAADENHVCLAIDQVEVAILVEVAHVAEGFPAVGARGGFGADVAVGGAAAARRQHEDLAHLAGRALAAVRFLNAKFAPAGRAAHRAGALEPLRARGERARDALGAAVGLVDLFGPDPLDPRALEPGGARRAGAHHAAQRREIEAALLGLGQAPDALHHGRHEQHPIDAVSLDQLEREPRLEAVHHDDRSAAQQLLPGRDEGTGVIQRAGD